MTRFISEINNNSNIIGEIPDTSMYTTNQQLSAPGLILTTEKCNGDKSDLSIF